MKEENAIEKQIKKYIKYRNKTLLMTADEMGIKNTTFSQQLKRGTLKADTLFKLAAYLDIDLNLMMQSLNESNHTGRFDCDTFPRMSPSYRKNERDQVVSLLDYHINLSSGNTNEIRQELLKDFRFNRFYLLDVLLPEEFGILVYTERDEDKLLVDTFERNTWSYTSMGSRSIFRTMYSADDALNIIIEERKKELL